MVLNGDDSIKNKWLIVVSLCIVIAIFSILILALNMNNFFNQSDNINIDLKDNIRKLPIPELLDPTHKDENSSEYEINVQEDRKSVV